MRRSGPRPRPLYFYLNQPNPPRCSDHPPPAAFISFPATSNRSITAIRIKCKCLRTSATRVLCKSATPLVITEWKLMSSFVTNGPRKWTRTKIRERRGKKKKKRIKLSYTKRKSIISRSKLSKTDWLTDCHPTFVHRKTLSSRWNVWLEREGVWECSGGNPVSEGLHSRGCLASIV